MKAFFVGSSGGIIFEPKRVYNFEVAKWHTYFVGALAWLVHNTAPGKCLTKIVMSAKDKITRGLLKKPKKRGQSLTFKSDGTSVEIHHVGQNPKGPFKELHWKDHRGKGVDKINHPNKGKPSKVDRKEFDKQKREYWNQEFDNWK